MAGLLGALNAGRTAVEAARVGIQVTGHNISNAGTEGYHRQRVETSAVAPPMSPVYGAQGGYGVQVDGVYRVADPLLAQQTLTATGDNAWAGARQTSLSQVERAVGSMGEGGLGTAIADFLAAFSALSAAPTDATTRSEVVAEAEKLALTFNRLSAGLNDVVEGTHSQVQSLVATLNNRAQQVAQLNAKITQAEAAGQEASDLRDQRDLLVGELAELGGVEAFTEGGGHVTVLIQGHTLVQGDQAFSVGATQATDGSTSVQWGGAGGPSLTLSFGEEEGGRLGGLLSAQRTVVDDLQPRLDQLASDLASAVNTQHQAGFDLDGNPGGDIFSVPATPSGSASGISVVSGFNGSQVAAASAAGSGPGDNSNALALAALADQTLAGGGAQTFIGEASSLVGSVGHLAEAATRAAQVREDELSYVTGLQQSSDGVSLDEEMIQLVEFQRAYQAGVRVLQVVDELMEGLIRL